MRIRNKIVVATAASGALALGAPLGAYAASGGAENGSGVLPGNDSGVLSNDGSGDGSGVLSDDGSGNGSDDILSDIVSNNDISAPINICDVNANVIGGEVKNDAAAKCQNNVDQSGDTSKDGGDDVLSDIVSNNDASVPVNVCDVNANVVGGEVTNDAAAECENNVRQADNGKNGDNGNGDKNGDNGNGDKNGDNGNGDKNGDKNGENGDNGNGDQPPEDGDRAKPAEPIVEQPSFAG